MDFETVYDQIDTFLREKGLKFIYDEGHREFHIGYLLNELYSAVELFIAVEKDVVVVDGYLQLDPGDSERLQLIMLINKINAHTLYGNFFLDDDDNFCIRNVIPCKNELDNEILNDLMESELFAFEHFSSAIFAVEKEGEFGETAYMDVISNSEDRPGVLS